MGLGAGAAAAIGAVGSVAGGLLGNKSGSGGTQQSQTNQGPYAPQVPFVQGGLAAADNVYQQRAAAAPYGGELVAGGNQNQLNANQEAYRYLNGQGTNLPYYTGQAAQGLMGAAPTYVANATNIAANGIGGPNAGLYGTLQGYGTGSMSAQGPSSGLSTALNGAAINGANSLNGFNSGLQQAGSQGLSDPTQRIANDAATYANNPGVQAALNSTNANIQDILNERTIPQLNRSAAMGGMLNSSRAGMAEAMANKDAALTQGSADASILNNAYNTGMNTASGLYASGLNSSINANSSGLAGANATSNNVANLQQNLGEFNTTAQLGAANSGLTQGLNYGLGNANTRLLANGQLGSGVNSGVVAANAAGSQAQGNFGLGSSAGTQQQNLQQAADNNAYQQWLLQNQYQQGVLNDYWKVAATPLGTNGSTSVQSTLPPANPVNSAVGGALAGAGLYQNFAGSNNGGFGTSNANDPYNANGLTQNTLNTIASNAASSPYASYQPPDLSGLY